MCCSLRAATFFLSSLHLYFATAQLIGILPTALSSIPNRTLEALLALLFALFFFSSGFMTFRGADEESSVLISIGGVLLLLILTERFVLMHFSLLLNPTLPEGDFLNAYGTTIPVIFTILLYLFYLSILFVYHNELRYTQAMARGSPVVDEKVHGSPRNYSGVPIGPAGTAPQPPPTVSTKNGHHHQRQRSNDDDNDTLSGDNNDSHNLICEA